MSLTGRPRSPPLALTSSSQIFWASSADLPLGASPPVSAMLKPILIGSPDCAQAAPANTSAHAAKARARHLTARHVASCSIVILPLRSFLRPSYEQRDRHTSGPLPVHAPLARRIAAFDHDGLDLARAVAAEGRGAVVFGRGEAGDALFEGRELDHHEAVEFCWPFHDLIAAAAGEHLAAELGDDPRHEVGVFLVFDRIVDLRPRNPIGRHGDVLAGVVLLPSPTPWGTVTANLKHKECCSWHASSSTFPCRWKTTSLPIRRATARRSTISPTGRRRRTWSSSFPACGRRICQIARAGRSSGSGSRPTTPHTSTHRGISPPPWIAASARSQSTRYRWNGAFNSPSSSTSVISLMVTPPARATLKPSSNASVIGSRRSTSCW